LLSRSNCEGEDCPLLALSDRWLLFAVSEPELAPVLCANAGVVMMTLLASAAAAANFQSLLSIH
jgi:hypothetical protein